MIDVNKITSTLAKLPDAQLQQYAQMHKNDPYIMALAMSESNRRKELRDAAPTQQGMQEQPKVIDQMLAEMAPQQMPEEMGIGRLPAGNMNFANGGIVAFAGGGDVEHYYGGGSTGDMYDSAKARAAAAQQKLYSYGLRQRQLDPAGFQAAQQELAAAQAVLQTAKQGYERDLTATGLNRPAFSAPTAAAPIFQEAPAASAAAPVSYDPAENVRKIAQTNADRITYNVAPKNAEEAALLQRYSPTAKAADAAPKPDTGRKAPGIGAPAAGPRIAATQPVDAGPQGIEALQKQFFDPLNQEIGVLRNQRAGLAAEKAAMGKEFEEATNKRIAERGDVYKGREERLAKREGELEGMGSKYAGLALLQAGAAMMSTPGGIGMALGKGVQVGSERYAAGIEKINIAKEKFAEARERLDDLRINRDDMNARDKEAARREAKRLEMEGRELIHNGAVQDLGMKEKQVTAVFGAAANALNTDKEIKARKEISGMEIAARERIAQLPQGNERIAMLLGGGDLAKGLAKFTEIQAGKFNPTTAYTDYLSKRKEGDSVLTPQEFVTQIRSIQALMAGAPSVSSKPTGKAFD